MTVPVETWRPSRQYRPQRITSLCAVLMCSYFKGRTGSGVGYILESSSPFWMPIFVNTCFPKVPNSCFIFAFIEEDHQQGRLRSKVSLFSLSTADLFKPSYHSTELFVQVRITVSPDATSTRQERGRRRRRVGKTKGKDTHLIPTRSSCQSRGTVNVVKAHLRGDKRTCPTLSRNRWTHNLETIERLN